MLLVYVHDREDKILVSLGRPPKEITTIHLKLDNQSEIGSIEGTVTEKQVTLLNKEHSHCKTYEKGAPDFNACSKEYIYSQLKETINCTTPGIFLNSNVLLKLLDHIPFKNELFCLSYDSTLLILKP
jgi:hypothetical protein